MKRLDQIKNLEVEALTEFQEHIGNVLSDLEIYREYVGKKRLKKLNKCYDYLDTLWESIEDTICQILDKKERGEDFEAK